MSSKKKLEQRKEFKEYLSIADKRVLDIRKSEIELIADDEIFVLVNGTNNYWISNYGRPVNNLHGKFYMHKTGYAHFTLSGVDKKIDTYTDLQRGIVLYYECDGESMAIDKDLLFPGNKKYASDKCCIIPQTLNTMLSNCKKHKQADILIMADKYKNKVPKKVYDALLRFEIKPYIED